MAFLLRLVSVKALFVGPCEHGKDLGSPHFWGRHGVGAMSLGSGEEGQPLGATGGAFAVLSSDQLF